MVLDGLPSLYGLKYDSATSSGLPLYLCSYKLVSSATCVTGDSEKEDPVSLSSVCARAQCMQCRSGHWAASEAAGAAILLARLHILIA